MASQGHTELTLPSDPSFVRLARSYARELATLAGLSADEVSALELAADEASANVIQHAFDPGEPGSFTLAGDLTPAALTLAIRERGLPFDPSLAPTFTPLNLQDPAQLSTRGMGSYLIRLAVDEVHWINHGKEGMELRLVKYRPQVDVAARLPEAQLTRFHGDEALAPEQTYTIRRLRPDEAIGVAQCIYRTYGYTYPNEDLYYPERIVHLNETGELISAVAVDEAGEVVGHYALERPDLGRVAESAQAVVAPAHRGRQLMERMRAFLEEEGRKLGLVGIYSQPVTNHVYSQRVNEDFGSHVCGVSLGLAPRAVTFKKIHSEPLPQRETLLLYFKYLGQPATAVVHAPAHHRAMLERIYARLSAPVDFRVPEATSGPGRVAVSFQPSYGLGIIRVGRVGVDTSAEMRRARRDLCEIAAAEVVYLELPLAQPGTPDLCLAAEAEGFFFSGLGPSFAPDGDVLRLQYLNVELDLTRLQVASPFGRELVAYVAGERERVGRPGERESC
jgi:anti-sigma regulatory factor (Ser/Thr protein kinase)